MLVALVLGHAYFAFRTIITMVTGVYDMASIAEAIFSALYMLLQITLSSSVLFTHVTFKRS